jgi:hypothetical protein
MLAAVSSATDRLAYQKYGPFMPGTDLKHVCALTCVRHSQPGAQHLCRHDRHSCDVAALRLLTHLGRRSADQPALKPGLAHPTSLDLQALSAYHSTTSARSRPSSRRTPTSVRSWWSRFKEKRASSCRTTGT